MSDTSLKPWHYLDDEQTVQTCRLLIIGCGNILRGDDAAGPVLIRRLWQGQIPEGVRISDGGTSGMDVAFNMRGAERVIIVDAARTGAKPGTLYKVPGEKLAQLPPLTGIASHDFRWDHALAFGNWLLGPYMPTEVSVYLIEGETYEYNAALSPVVDSALNTVIELIKKEWA